MSKLYAVGEALIDFIPSKRDAKLKEVTQFSPQVGGAPTNVASCVARLGGDAAIITQVGDDAFGEKITDKLNGVGVDTQYMKQTTQANTALAFVSLTADGERDFAFYRKPSADMLLEADQLSELSFDETDILHFCSVDLVDCPMKMTHRVLIDRMIEANGTVVFDPNLRFPLWDDLDALHHTVLEFIPKAHIVKISDEELEFITRIKDKEHAIASLFRGNVEAVIYTEGKAGASLYTKEGLIAQQSGYPVKVLDTTGAGDAFIGAINYQLLTQGKQTLFEEGKEYLRFANAVGALTTTAYGAIESLPTQAQTKMLMRGESHE
ncbi:carbohydrate kinase family protein [Staphylococcus simulans]|uniref:carbohydrate kinase family protein n=1 Tax=Staphylococcus simulans TaxID=1286 RepID=UPI00399A107F